MRDLGYNKVEGNRFARAVKDVPVPVVGGGDVPRGGHRRLGPGYTSRARQNCRISEDLVTTEVLGLATALRREPVEMTLDLKRLNGEVLNVHLASPE